MTSVHDLVADAEFTIDTTATPDEIHRATQRAAEAARVRGGAGKLKELQRLHLENGREGVFYDILVGYGGVQSARFRVVWWVDEQGQRRVGLFVDNFHTSQQKILFLIPAGPKRVPSLKALLRFGEALRLELSAAQATHAPRPSSGDQAALSPSHLTGEPRRERGWYVDPFGRHQNRWWDGRQWTEVVGDDGLLTRDPMP